MSASVLLLVRAIPTQCGLYVVKPKLDKLLLFMPYEYDAIKIACLSSSLVALRKFDDFFADKKSIKDDVAVSDFDYQSQELLSADERIEIKKRIAHFTESYIENVDKNWDIISMLIRLGGLVVSFLNYLLTLCEASHKYIQFEINETIKFTEHHVAAYRPKNAIKWTLSRALRAHVHVNGPWIKSAGSEEI